MPAVSDSETRGVTAMAVRALLDEVIRSAGGGADRSAALTVDPERAAEILEALGPVASATGREVTWVAVNGRRVDATVVAPGGREWRLACSIDGDGVHSASVFERPRRFEGVPGGRAVIVDGPSSVGKSTVMSAVAARSTTPWVVFDEPSFGVVALPFLIWPETAPSLQSGFVAGMAGLAAAGNQVITSTGRLGPSDFEPLLRAVPATIVVRLDCPLEVRVARQAGRTDRWGGLTEGSDDEQLGGWSPDLRFDTSCVTAGEIADRILATSARLEP